MVERIALREFQAQLAERLRLARTRDVQSASLGVAIGERRYLVDVLDAGEILSIPSIRPVPLARGWFRGMVNLRGVLVTVNDLQQFDGGEPTPLTKESRLLSFGSRFGTNAAVLVTRMLGLRDAAAMRSASVPAHEARAWLGAAWTDETGVVWRELDLERLVHDDRFLAIGRLQENSRSN